MTTHPSILACVLFSKNWAGKAQAGRFSSADADRATAAALKNGASVVFFSEGDDADLIAAIPTGRFGENDRPLLTSVRQNIFKRLVAVAETQGKVATPAQSNEKAAEADVAKSEPKAPARKKAAAMLAKSTDTASGEALISVVIKEGAKHWPGLQKGDVVLAPEFTDGQYDGWWEAVVVARSESHVTLEWRDYKDYPTFTRPITQVAPIHPECRVAV